MTGSNSIPEPGFNQEQVIPCSEGPKGFVLRLCLVDPDAPGKFTGTSSRRTLASRAIAKPASSIGVPTEGCGPMVSSVSRTPDTWPRRWRSGRHPPTSAITSTCRRRHLVKVKSDLNGIGRGIGQYPLRSRDFGAELYQPSRCAIWMFRHSGEGRNPVVGGTNAAIEPSDQTDAASFEAGRLAIIASDTYHCANNPGACAHVTQTSCAYELSCRAARRPTRPAGRPPETGRPATESPDGD